MSLSTPWAALDAAACLAVSTLALIALLTPAYADNLGQRVGLFGAAQYGVLHGFDVAAAGSTTVAALGLSLGLLAFGLGIAVRVYTLTTIRHEIERERAELRRISSMRMDLDDHVGGVT